MKDNDKQSYARIRRELINHIKKTIEERDEGQIRTVFCKYSENEKSFIHSFVSHNLDLCERYFEVLLNESNFKTIIFYPNRERIKNEIFYIEEASSLELAHFFIVYVTVEEFNVKLRQIRLPFAKDITDETICDSEISKYYYFRGQTQGWPIAPSVLRGLKDNININIDGLMHLYEINNLIAKYNELYCDHTSQNSIYYKVAFIQHACSFSPFIDFSKKSIVATSFALSNTNQFNIFNTEKSYIYRLIVEDSIDIIDSRKKASDFLKNINSFCIHINDSFAYGKTYQYDEYVGNVPIKKSLTIYTPSDLYNALRPKLIIFDSPTNDRMKYQSGVFALFYDYVSFKGELKYWYASGFSILSHSINPKSKRKIINMIRRTSDGWYESNLLINPYEIFNR